ncbi:ribosomal RNA large subunit methyltransferase J [Capsaspora owczarzaki ATCC 30864]|uniref:rRNA methyltransferase 2, mitochondrial n=1 Tax=Capsaspora owczarzaki (strain ATCC 30864) TaxID=595528 RepID=A0A0D2X2U2_CAPO3|nr:ribosomal RNA large subunit methyltransferase J [Capsaspora owczarzaki ATCC 30864]KJE93154.1 ribosomal RNA large subunit methyltransferase J [Capsaspora owczarzaki ATCC 30864]|eukprot:XP_004347808.2 ribosomal RNA large subunit methyltransferase J [Capsaspora owczarzaki ATCC 30864]
MLRSTAVRLFSTLSLHGSIAATAAASGSRLGASSSRWTKRQQSDPYVHQALEDGYRCRSAYKLKQLDDKFHFLRTPAGQAAASKRATASTATAAQPVVVRSGLVVIDCGARPGGWTQVAVERVGKDFRDLLLRHSNETKQSSGTPPMAGAQQNEAHIDKEEQAQLKPNATNASSIATSNGAANAPPSPPLSPLVLAVDIEPMERVPGAIVLPQADMTATRTHNQLAAILGTRLVDVVLSDMAPPASGNAGVTHLQCVNLIEAALRFATRFLRIDGWFVCKSFHGTEDQLLTTTLRRHFREVHFCKPPATRTESGEFYYVCEGFVGR